MTKSLSTYERKMKDAKFREAYQKGYKELLFSELIIAMMENDKKSVRKLAEEADLSPSVIQDLRSGKQHDIRVINLIKLAQSFGYEVVLKKGKKSVILHEVKDRKHQRNIITAAV